MPTQFIRQEPTSELCKDVTVEEGAEDYSLLCGGPVKVLCLDNGAVGQSDVAHLGHGDNRHAQINTKRVDIEETEEGHQDHHISGESEDAVRAGDAIR